MPRSRGSNKRPVPDGQTCETEDADRGACSRKTLAVLYISPTVEHRLPHSERARGGGRALPPQPPQPSTSRWRQNGATMAVGNTQTRTIRSSAIRRSNRQGELHDSIRD
jgi:hypothetical protein